MDIMMSVYDEENFFELAEWATRQCNDMYDGQCPVGFFKCPFNTNENPCGEVTIKMWMDFFESYKKD